MNAADRHDFLVKAGRDRFIDTYLMLFEQMAKGGRTPGVRIPTKKELLEFFESTNAEYWTSLAQASPEEATSQLEQFEQVSKEPSHGSNTRSSEAVGGVNSYP